MAKTARCGSIAWRCRAKNEVCDTRTWLEHNKGFRNSRQLHKTIVSDKGRAGIQRFDQRLAQHAIKTDGQMTNNNLLMGKLAEVDTKPQLEIYADDVKCSHGATVGRIDDEQMFYLRSRGINQQDAQQMIIYAFAAELNRKHCVMRGWNSRCWPESVNGCQEVQDDFFRRQSAGRLSGAFA
ncbi:SufD family Fe-S cluster assembly protein [Escherichia coli]